MSHSIVLVDPGSFRAGWSLGSPHLMKGLAAAPELTLRAVVDALVDGTMVLWLVARDTTVLAAFLTEKTTDNALHVFGLGGSGLQDWVYDLDVMMQKFARATGCSRVTFAGQAGYRRLLPAYEVHGEKNGHLLYVRELD